MSPELTGWITSPKKHVRHRWELQAGAMVCGICGYPQPTDRVRRGRLSRNRGNAIEREIAHRLGLARVGQFGGPDDVGSAHQPFIGQVKSGGAFPERIYRWLKALPSNAAQTPIVVLTDAPGPGIRRRALVVLTLEDWIELHGPVTPPAE